MSTLVTHAIAIAIIFIVVVLAMTSATLPMPVVAGFLGILALDRALANYDTIFTIVEVWRNRA